MDSGQYILETITDKFVIPTKEESLVIPVDSSRRKSFALDDRDRRQTSQLTKGSFEVTEKDFRLSSRQSFLTGRERSDERSHDENRDFTLKIFQNEYY